MHFAAVDLERFHYLVRFHAPFRRDANSAGIAISEEQRPRWGQIAVTSVIAITPAFLFVLLLQHYTVRGLVGGSLKG
jgi:ABC-type glycerol-3-phosphate transport system permease component